MYRPYPRGTGGTRGTGRPRLFVEYRFLDVPPEELESPYSLPLPEPGQKLVFNFKKGEWNLRRGVEGNRRIVFFRGGLVPKQMARVKTT